MDAGDPAYPTPPASRRAGQPRSGALHEEARLPEDLCAFDKAKLRVGILLWPEFTLLALSGFVDALRLASDIGDRSRQVLCRWEVMAEQRSPITASCGLQVTPTGRFVDPRLYDYVAVVAGRTERLEDVPASSLDYVRAAARAGVPLIGICTGSFVLAHLGLLDGRRACVANFHHREFAERFPRVTVAYDQLYCIDRDRITCAGGAASIDLAAHLVREHCGTDRATKVIRTVIVDALRQPNAAQRVLRVDHEQIADARVSRAISIMEQSIAEPVSIRSIAEQLNTSDRQLERAFKLAVGVAPARYFRQLRLRHGHWLLANTRASISQIAFDCGFADNSHFTRAFQEEFGETPSATRRRPG